MHATPGKRPRITVFLVDDHPLVREGVRSYLTQHAIDIVGEASDATEALRRIPKAAPDVVVLDVNLPAIDGGALARRLRALRPGIKIIAFSLHSGQEYVVRMARSGAGGYVTKDRPAVELLEAIRTVYRGGLHFPPDMADALLVPETGGAPDGSAKPKPTLRELEVLRLLAEGHANKSIALKLGISVRTVETHRENLYRKLDIRSVAGLTKYALARGLTKL